MLLIPVRATLAFPDVVECEYKVETKRRRPFHPRTANAQWMVAGIAFDALQNGGLELFANQACEN